jgi:hypothetical protein
MGFLEVYFDPWIWCQSVPCWFHIPEETADAGQGWVSPTHPDTLEIEPVVGTNWGYSFALGKWLYLTETEWVYLM